MYPYHNRIKQRINNGELISVEKTEGEFAVIFHFKTYPFSRPVRAKSLHLYSEILEKNGEKIIKNYTKNRKEKSNKKRKNNS